MEQTTTFTALVAHTLTDTEFNYVQVMPADPVPGTVTPFRGWGYGQMLSNGTFDFVRRPIKRRKPALKLPHSSVSFGSDGYIRYTFTLPAEQKEECAELLYEEASEAAEFIFTQTI